jgi:uncharacterized phage-associated protein
MNDIKFKFDRAKAIEAILYLANRIQSECEVYGLCKLLYFADKLSLEQYGRFLFGDSYVAMEQGTTPSDAYDLLKPEANLSDLRIEENNVIPLRDADLDYFSKSDIKCLDKIIERDNSTPSKYYRWSEAHDEAWKKAWDRRGTQKSHEIPVESIAEMLNEPDDLIDYLLNPG